jgi:PAS domain S-box-containing protein
MTTISQSEEHILAENAVLRQRIDELEGLLAAQQLDHHQRQAQATSETALAQCLVELEALFESLPNLLFLIDRDLRIHRCSRTVAAMIGMPRSAIEGHKLDEYLPTPHFERFAGDVQALFDKPHPSHSEENVLLSSGLLVLDVYRTPVFDEQGTLVAALISCHDITETRQTHQELELRTRQLEASNQQLSAALMRYQEAQHEIEQLNAELEQRVLQRTAELRAVNLALSKEVIEHRRTSAALRASEAALRAERDLLNGIMNTSVAAITVLDTSGQIIFANPSAEQVLGIKLEDLTTRRYNSPEWQATDLDGGLWSEENQPFRRVLNTGEPVYDVRHAIVGPGQQRRLLSVNGAAIKDVDGHMSSLVFLVNDITERLQIEEALRRSEERYRLITESSHDLICLLDRESCFAYISPSFFTTLGYRSEDLLGRAANDFIHPDDQAQARASWRRSMERGRDETAFRFAHRDGSWRWFEVSSTLAEQGKEYLAVVVGRDVTEQRRLEAQLAQSQKLEAIGRLAGGVAHDFNNLLVVISGCTEMAAATLPDAHPAQYDLREIQQATLRAASLTRQLLAFARRQATDPRPLQLNDLIAGIETLLRRLIRENVDLHLRCQLDLWPVRADPAQMEQVLVNLAVNGRDAMPDGGLLLIETMNVSFDDETSAAHLGLTAGDYVVLTVSDTGVGMSEEVQRHAFEPFFTTKPTGQGTGLGLATCYGIVAQHGGAIYLCSEEGVGSTISIYLPRYRGIDTPQVELEATPVSPLGSETILLIEDDAAVRRLTTRVLSSFGYQILSAADGQEALMLTRELPPNSVHLLLTDIVMPGISGQDVRLKVIEQHPSMRVLYMSGYTDTMVVQHATVADGTPFLQKPFTPRVLLERVRTVLDSV